MNGEQYLKMCLNAPPGTRAKIEMLLSGDESVAPAPIADARTCTQSEAARRLGISRSKLILLMHRGVVRSVNITGVPRVLLSSIDEIARGKINAGDNPETARWIARRSAHGADAGRKGAAARIRNREGSGGAA